MRPVNFEYRVDIAKAYEDEGRWIIEGLAATSDFDLQEDVITQEAIEGSARDLIENSTVLLNHSVSEPIGKVLSSAAQKSGLFLKILVSKTVPDIWQKIKEGVLNKFSVRGKILDARKQWIPELRKYARMILKMRLVEVSLVAVPANPKARAMRWYIEKALDLFEESGGRLEEKSGEAGIPGPRKGEDAMGDEAKGDGLVLVQGSDQGSGDKGFPSPGKLEEEWTAHCKERGVEKDKATREDWEGFCKSNGYPYPYPYPYPKATGGGQAMGRIVAVVDQLLAEEKDEARKKLLSQIREIAAGASNAYPAPGALKDAPVGTGKEGAADGVGKPAPLLDLGIAKADLAMSKPHLKKLKKLVEELQKIILEVEPAEGDEARKDAPPAEETDAVSKALSGIAEAVKRIEGTLAPKAGEKDSKILDKQVEDFAKRLSTLEGKAGTRASLEGQEELPGAKRGGKSMWKGVV